ncbi:MAG: AAA family ATPase [Planctomycetota bacterium]|jgi:ABC-type lipoprotein export system ATPase subunit
MNLRTVKVANFKGIKKLDFDLLNLEKHPRELTCIVGDNGSGKTSVLQAIALPLSIATRRIRYAHELDWHGFLPERISSLGPTRIELEVEFTTDEIRITQELFQKWYDSLTTDFRESKQITAPSDSRIVTLTYEQNRLSSAQGIPGLHQFLGRYYVKALQKSEPGLRDLYASLGDIFWFDQHRNLGSVSAQRFSNDDGPNGNTESWLAGVENLREFLVGWWGYHTSHDKSYGKDYIPDLETGFQRIFPDRRFIGTAPRQSGGSKAMGDFYFLIQSRDRVYDLAEMSSGEQSIFPLLYEFVRLDIAHSIVLLDELELHLHPPEQQRLLTSLSKLGPDCQFIVTTHSQFLTNAIPDEQEVHLEGGTRCL